jgi:hypothetical protein
VTLLQRLHQIFTVSDDVRPTPCGGLEADVLAAGLRVAELQRDLADAEYVLADAEYALRRARCP